MIKINEWKKLSKKQRDKILERSQIDYSGIVEYVQEWIDVIRHEGDDGIVKYVREFDNKDFRVADIKVTKSDIERAYKEVNPKGIDVLKRQIEISSAYAKSNAKQEIVMKEFVPGAQVGHRVMPIDSAGLVIPAGRVPYPSVMQILGVTAKAAGVPRISAVYPPTGYYPELLIAADIAGIDEVYRVGGIAGVAALTYGTDNIDPVLVISGPGNRYVQAAKQLVFKDVGIDMIAGPSENLVIADDKANPKFVAADVMNEAEHSPDTTSLVVTYSESLAKDIQKQVEKQIKTLSKKEIIEESFKNNSQILLFTDLLECIDFTNDFAPEHMQIMTEKPFDILPKIRNAGSIYLGAYSPVSVGNYASGSNHILPTGKWAKRASAVGIDTFQKYTEIEYLTKEGLENLAEIVDVVSNIETFDAHWNSVGVRLPDYKRFNLDTE